LTISPTLVRELAAAAGFDLVRFGPADPGPDAARFAAWLDAGRAGEMHYLHRNRERIMDPAAWAKGARSTIALAFDYGGPPGRVAGGGRVARYAVGRDYHRALGNRLRSLRQRLEAEGAPEGTIKIGTDAVPVLERALAARAGIGFLAKSAGVIAPHHGPYLLLAELLTPLELPPDGPAPGSCGTCTRCLDACPTGAIVAPFQIDARRCLSYTTIELRGPIPRELRAPQGEWLFGCDVCLEVCPFTSRGRNALGPDAERPAELRPHAALESYSLLGILELSEQDYARDWTGTAMRRATRSGLRRNAAVVLGNLGRFDAVPALERALADPDPVLRGHAAWALGRLEPDAAALHRALAGETDPDVRAEIRAALAGDPRG
jgi:epoxyqueuosine reductase